MSDPIKTFRCGAITAAVWLESKVIDQALVEMHSIKITKSYKDGEEWKYTHSLSVEDLPKVALVANEAYKFIRLRVSDKDSASHENQQ